MANDTWGFKDIGSPSLPGRVISRDPPKAIQPVIDTSKLESRLDEVADKLKNIEDTLKEPFYVEVFPNGVTNLPYDVPKQLTLLKGIELYLMGQLAAVRKQVETLENLNLESEHETEEGTH